MRHEHGFSTEVWALDKITVIIIRPPSPFSSFSLRVPVCAFVLVRLTQVGGIVVLVANASSDEDSLRARFQWVEGSLVLAGDHLERVAVQSVVEHLAETVRNPSPFNITARAYVTTPAL